MKDENPYSAPEDDEDSYLEEEIDSDDDLEEEEPIPYKFGGPLVRYGAKLIDFIAFSLIFIVCIGFFELVQMVSSEGASFSGEAIEGSYDKAIEESYADQEEIVVYVEHRETNATGLHGFISVLALLVAGAICEWKTGLTPGKFIFGLRVVRAYEIAPPSIGSALGRNIAILFDGMFLGVPALFIMRTNPYQQRMGDVAANTFVVKKSSMPDSLGISTADYLIGLAGVVVNFAIFAFILMII